LRSPHIERKCLISLSKVIATAGLAMLAQPTFAKDIDVQMKNQGAAGIMVFKPALVSAAVGDSSLRPHRHGA
jgi:plastocyanin